MNENQKETFYYSYSANEREEVNQIRAKYLPKEENKMDQLRKMDAAVTRPGTILSIITGTISTLIFGVGMSLALLDGGSFAMIMGILIGIIGIAGIAVAYPLYLKITKKERERLAPQILALTEELLKQN